MALRTFPALVWTAVLLIACFLPGGALSFEERHFHLGTAHLDKIVHAALFAGFGWSWMQAADSRRQRTLVLVIGLAMAVLTELGQGLSFIRRDPDPLDSLADALGLFLGMGLAHVQARWLSDWSRRALKPEGSATSG